jgi:hypothetical protein
MHCSKRAYSINLSASKRKPLRTKRSWIVHLKVKGGSRFLAL